MPCKAPDVANNASLFAYAGIDYQALAGADRRTAMGMAKAGCTTD